MEQVFAHCNDRILRNKDFISPLKKFGWKANNYDSLVASVYDMDVFEMKWTRWELSYPDVVWNGIKSLTLDLYSLDIIDDSFIGHEPFSDDLTYAHACMRNFACTRTSTSTVVLLSISCTYSFPTDWSSTF